MRRRGGGGDGARGGGGGAGGGEEDKAKHTNVAPKAEEKDAEPAATR